MNLLRFQSVFAICLLLLLFGFNQIKSTTTDEEFCGYSDVEEDLCSSYCYKSMKAPLSYILELKEQIKANSEEQKEKDNEIKELRKRLDDLNDYRDHIKSLNDHIQELRKTNEILRESVQNKNNYGKTEEDLKVKAKDLNECMADQDKLKKEVEIERKSKIEIGGKLKLEMENLRKENERIINEFKIKSKKDFADHKVKEDSLSNESKDLISYYKEQLKEPQNQLAEKEHLADISTSKMNLLERNLTECMESIILYLKTSCKGLPSGIYAITIPNLDPFPALCNGDIANGGWMVIQKRFDGSEDFYRNWTEYRKGFGKLDGEFFIGLENLHRITNSQRYELYIEMKDIEGNVEFVRYDNFRIGNENEKYNLQSVGDSSGTAENCLTNNVDVNFSTYDQDNDGYEDINLAEYYHGGWWYKTYNVYWICLNGRYYKSQSVRLDAMRRQLPLKSVQMLIRPKSN